MKSLVRRQPFQELSSFQQEMNWLFGHFYGRSSPPLFEDNLGAWGFGPPMDVYEDGEKLKIIVEIPGFDEKNLRVEVVDNILTVSGERRPEKDVKKENIRPMERHYRIFLRSFTLPNTVAPEEIEANYACGVLTLDMLKASGTKSKQIKVNVSKALKAR